TGDRVRVRVRVRFHGALLENYALENIVHSAPHVQDPSMTRQETELQLSRINPQKTRHNDERKDKNPKTKNEERPRPTPDKKKNTNDKPAGQVNKKYPQKPDHKGQHAPGQTGTNTCTSAGIQNKAHQKKGATQWPTAAYEGSE